MTEPRIEYATPSPGGRSYWPAAIFCGTGLGLIGLGGCFLIGVMIMTNAGNTVMAASTPTPPALLLLITLFLMAFVCFISAAAMIYQGVQRMR